LQNAYLFSSIKSPLLDHISCNTADFHFSKIVQDTHNMRIKSNLGFLLGRRIAIPSDTNPTKALFRAIKLAKNDEFKEKRRKLYDWQEDVIRKIKEEKIDEEKALEEMDTLIKEYNLCVSKGKKKVYYKLAYTIGISALGIAGSFLNPFASAAAILAVIKFVHTDRKPIL
jgi:hypothetical protein